MNHFVIFIFVFTILNALSVFAGPSRTTYQAKIIKPDGYPLEATSVNFKFTILDMAGSCILYSETFSTVNMGSSAGLVSFSLGTGVRTFPVSGSTFEQVFSNTTASLTCDSGGPATYSPSANDTRKIVMQFNDGNGWQTLPAMTINAVPYAMYANDSLKFSGKDITEFVQVASLPTCGVSEAMRFNGVGFSCIAVGGSVTSGSVITALGYTPADGASVTALTSNVSSVSSTVASVSSTVFSVSSTVTSLQSSVAASFAAITSSQWTTSGTNIFYNTGSLGIGTTTPVTKLDVSGGVRIGAESTTCAPALAGTLRYNATNVEYCNGTSWQAFGVSGAGITNFNGSTSGTQSFATGTGGTALNIATANGVHTLNIPLASTGSVTAGLISNADYATFTNKITSSAASIAQVLGYVPADNAASGTYAQKANNLSDLTNVVTARTNLGLGTFATASSIDLGSASATGTLAIARLPSFSGDATIAAASNTIILSNSGVTAGTYTKVTVDTKGRVTSGSQITSSDVTTALGYTPANSATTVSSQWSTSGTTINYMNGNVGIGTTGPQSKLQINTSFNEVNKPSGLEMFINGGNTNADVGKLMISPDGNMAVGGLMYINHQTAPSDRTVLNLGTTGFSGIPATMSLSNGNVGIGTTSPSDKLTLDTGNQRLSDGYGFRWGDSSVGIYGNGTNETFSLYTNATQRLIVDSSGNVGIGVTNPSAKLELASGTASLAPLKFTSGTLLSSAQSGSFEYDGFNFYVTDSTNTRRAIAANANPGTYDNVSNINSSSNITLTPTGSVVVSSTTASTNSSTGALVVKGGLGVAGDIYTSGTIVTSSNIQGVSVTATSGMISPYIYGSTLANGNLRLESTTNNTKGYVLLASQGGNVGVGVTSTNYPLQVSGTAHIDSLRIGFSAGTNFLMSYNSTSTLSNAAWGWSLRDNFNNADKIFVERQSDGGDIIFGNGNVGIGTSSPTFRLDVAGDIGLKTNATYIYGKDTLGNNTRMLGMNSSNVLYVGDIDSRAAGVNVIATASDLNLIAQSANNVLINTSGTERVRVTAAGNVGIGTTTPGLLLETSGVNGFPATSGTTQSGSFRIGNSVSQRVLDFGIDGATSTAWLQATTRTNLADKNLLVLNPNGGSVGIGTTSPLAPLHVNSNSGAPSLYLQNTSTSLPYLQFQQGSFMQAMDANGSLRLRTPANGFLVFDTNGTNERMRIDSAGNVGIGTTAPAAKLHVAGSAQIDGEMSFGDYRTYLTDYTGGVQNKWRYFGTSTSNNGHIRVQGVLGGHDLATAQEGQMFIDLGFNARSGFKVYGSIYGKVSVSNGNAIRVYRSADSLTFYYYIYYGSYTQYSLNVFGSGAGDVTSSQTATTVDPVSLGYTLVWNSADHVNNNGIAYFSGSTSSASSVMMVSDSGNVGIGTTNPSHKLHIKDQYPYLAFEDTENASGSVGTITYNQDGNFYFDADNPNTGTDSGFRFRANGGTKQLLSILNSGNVGIGTTSPASKLDVNGVVISSGFSFNGSEVGADTGLFEANDGLLQLKSNGAVVLHTNRGDNEGGYVGIGTSSPTEKLHVQGNSKVGDTASTGTVYMQLLGMHDTAGGSGFRLQFDRTNDIFGIAREWSGFQSPSFVIKRSDGNVGIGTTSPGAKLDVQNSSTFVSNGTGANTYFRNSSSTNGDYLGIGWIGEDNWAIMSADSATYRNLLLQPFGGNVGIGTTSPGYNLTVSSGNAGGYTIISNRNTAAGGQDWRWYSSSTGAPLGTDAMCFGTGACLFTLYTTGNATLAGTLTQSSDARLKRDISSINHALDSITKIEGVTYYWKDNAKEQTKQMGLIAQNVEAVFPEAVKTDTRGFKSVAYQNLVAPIINAIREIRDWMFKTDDRIHLLEIDNAKLKQRNADLEAYLCAKDPNAPICK